MKIETLYLQYRSKVSWQSLEPRASSLETRYSIRDSFEYRVSSLEDRVSSLELRVEKVNELVAWLISREINCTNGLSLAITKMSATDSIVNTDKGTRVFSCDVYANEWNKIVFSIENTFACIAAWKKEHVLIGDEMFLFVCRNTL